MNKFSIFHKGITTTIPDEDYTLDKVIELTKSTLFKESIEKIQTIKHSDPKELKKLRNQIKKNLSYITVAGTFKERKKDQIIEPSGYAAIDIDELKDTNNLKEELKADPFINFMFTSPSGNGLKLIINIPPSITEFSQRVRSYYNYLQKTYNIAPEHLDISTHDISRACFLSYDPECYHNSKSQTYTDMEVDPVAGKPKDTTRSAIEYREIVKLLYTGKSKEQIYKALESFEKWKDASIGYKEHTFKKAEAYVKTQKLTSDEKNDLINELVNLIMIKFHMYTMLSDKNPDMYIYKEGIYIPDGKAYLHKYIHKCVGKYYTKSFGDKIIEKITVQTYIRANDFFEETDPKFLCVENGILNLETQDLHEFTPKLRFFNKLPVTFDPSMKCITTMNHFDTVLKEADRALMQEIYGFLLFRNYKFQKAFMFSGDGGNGKSIVLEQIKQLLGIDNITNLSLETLETQHFMKCQLHKKMANLADDIGNARLSETRTFKECTGGSIITADKKGTDAITFTNYAKMIFNANQIPIIDDNTDGFWRRWIIIRFDVSFLLEPEFKTRKEKGTLLPTHRIADTSIIKKLTTKEELSGVLNWAIEGFKRLNDQNGFSYTKSLEETRKYMRRFSSSVLAFIHDCTENIDDPNQYELVPDMYRAYIKYCFGGEKRVHPESEINFRKLLEDEIPLERKRTSSGREHRAMFTKLIEVNKC